jgi:hypothetical protein
MGATTMFYVIGIASAVLLGIQLLLLMFGADMDFDADTDVDASDGGGFLSLRSLTGFFFGLGWSGVAAREAGWSTPVSLLTGIGVGLGMFVMIGLMFQQFRKLTVSRSGDTATAVGAVGSVYLTVGANRTRVGKVEVAVSGRVTIVDALTDVESDLRSGTRVLVVDRIDGGTVLVEPA